MPRRYAERDREICRLALFTEMTYVEIGLEMDVSSTNVRRIFFRECETMNRSLYAEILDQFNTRVERDALCPHRMILKYHALELYRDLANVSSNK
jgi:hypothetical protein